MSIEILKKQLQQASLEGLYLLMGEEQYLIDYYSEKIRACCTGTLPEMNFIEIDGKKPDFDYLADAVASYPVMAEKKLVLISDLDSGTLKGTGEKKLEAALADIAPGVTVLFREHAKEKAKASTLEKLIKKRQGVIIKTEKPTPKAMVAWIQKTAAREKSEIAEPDCIYLAELTGNSMLRIHHEIQKLAAFAKGPITRELIEKMVAPVEESSWFAISNAIAEHDFDGLMHALDQLYRQNTEDTVIAGMFYRAYIDLWRGEMAIREGKSQAELAAVCSVSPYSAARIMRSAGKMKEGEALYGLRRCLELDLKIKTSGLNKKDLIYTFAAELLEFQMRGL